MQLAEVIRQRIQADGPLPFATYAELALYHPELGYYARADRRSGRAGDFVTSVDLGPAFGAMLAAQFAEMWRHLDTPRCDLVEAAAGNGRLARDILNAAVETDRAFYEAIDLHLVERSPVARDAQAETLGQHRDKVVTSAPDVPAADAVTGILFANELLDALPPHVLLMTADGVREIYVDTTPDGDFVERIGPVSSPVVSAHLAERRIDLEPGWRVEVVPEAVAWVTRAIGSLDRGFALLIDYGHEARELYSPTHASGTLTTYTAHHVETATRTNRQPWLVDPGSRDITAHVDLTAVRETAESAGAVTLGVLDQTYFLLGLGAADQVTADAAPDAAPLDGLRRRLAMKALLIPGGLGSTQKVMVFGRRVGAPELAGLSYRIRAT